MAVYREDSERPLLRPGQLLIEIDGQEVVCERDETVLAVARRIGIHIPTLCNDPRLPASGACRLCIVEVEGARKVMTSCTTVVAEGMVVRTNTDKVRAMRHFYLELLLSDHNSFCTPPCRDACPTHIKIPQFLDFIAHRDYENGVRKLREDLPFPAVLGRVCPRPCEGPCRRQLVDQSITICQLHRFMADQCLDEEQEGELLLPVEPAADSGKRIAVVGAGPAGLAAAFYSRLEGHAVKMFEAQPKVGGMLRYGIPSYRLPRAVLEKETNVLWRLGVELQVNSRLGVDFELEDLLESYDVVFLALGAFNSNDMRIPGEDAVGVVTAVDFLGDLERDGDVHVGERVTVIGGGFTAMDACRTAVRKGATEVTCLYRRSRTEMPAHKSEVDEAEEEGVRLELLCAPVRVVTDDANRVTGIEMQRMQLGEPDASGRRRPVAIEGSEFVVECDQVITAIGQYPNLDGTTEEQGIGRTKWRTIKVDDWTYQTANPRVFAGGDAVLGAQTVIQAVAQGKKAAWSMDAFLRGEDMAQVSDQLAKLKARPFLDALDSKRGIDPHITRMAEIPPVFIDMTTDVSQPRAAVDMPMLRPEERRCTFEQIELGFGEDVAVEAAARCLDCYCPSNGTCLLQRHSIEYEVFSNRFHGASAHDYPADFRHDFIMREPNRCINCGRCVAICRTEVGASCYDSMGRGYDTIVSTADNLPLQMVGCVSCGKCAVTCPTGAIVTNPRTLERYGLDVSRCMFCGECVEVCPYGALEQKSYFELASFDRPELAGESLYVREPNRGDALRETVTDLVPHVLDAETGNGWVWSPIKDDPVDFDQPEEVS
ncbi:MAG: FAD-dependent oxidoreductase [Thermoleophilia bacterium]